MEMMYFVSILFQRHLTNMSIMKRRISYWLVMIALSLPVFLISSQTYAADDTNDCTLYANTDADKYPGVVEKWLEKWELPPLQFFTQKDLRTSVLHHQMACCEGVLKEDREICQQAKQETSDCKNCYAQSNYYLDHLVNVWMRKFDGIQDHCDELDISCEMNTSAVKTLERRERITEIAEDIEWYPPSLIMEEFLEYRGDGSKEDVNDPDKISNAYYNLCDEIQNIHRAIGVNPLAGNNDTNAYEKCRVLVQQRYQQEYMYVRTLMVDKGVQYFVQNTQDYLQEYFLKNRMTELVNKYARMDNCFTTVLRYATKTSCCNE